MSRSRKLTRRQRKRQKATRPAPPAKPPPNAEVLSRLWLDLMNGRPISIEERAMLGDVRRPWWMLHFVCSMMPDDAIVSTTRYQPGPSIYARERKHGTRAPAIDLELWDVVMY